MKEIYRGGVQAVRLNKLTKGWGLSSSALEEARHLQKALLMN
jgi:hypothetical protein